MTELETLIEENKLTLAEHANMESNIPFKHLYWFNKSRITNLSKEPVQAVKTVVKPVEEPKVEKIEEIKNEEFDFLTEPKEEL